MYFNNMFYYEEQQGKTFSYTRSINFTHFKYVVLEMVKYTF